MFTLSLDFIGFLRVLTNLGKEGGSRVVDHLVDDGGALLGPLLDSHRLVRDDVLAQHMLDVLHITPTFGITVLQPNKRRSDIRWTMLDVVNNNRLLRTSRHEDLDGFVVIAVGALVE
jgi:hypothetical protein